MTTPQKPDAGRLGVVVLGASSFPGYDAERGMDNAAFARSAAAFHAIMAEPTTCLRGPPAILDLFDSPLPVADVVKAMQNFLKSTPSIEDLVIYYCGHGGLMRDRDRSYFLLLQSTESSNEAFTGLPTDKLRTALDFDLISKRVFFLLDCCYSARAVEGWMSTSIGDQIEAQVLEKFPREGTAMITASSKGKVALAGKGDHTIFTGTLLDTLRSGVPSYDGELSFRNVFERTRVLIEERYGEDASRPEIHVPVQAYGDISSSPFFHNRALDNRPVLPTVAERKAYDSALEILDLGDRDIRRASLTSLAKLYDATRSPTFRDEIRSKFDELSRTHDSAATREYATMRLARMAAPPAEAKIEAPVPEATSSGQTSAQATPAVESSKLASDTPIEFGAINPAAATTRTMPAYTPPRDSFGTSVGKFISGLFGLVMIWLLYATVTHLPEIWQAISDVVWPPKPNPIILTQPPSFPSYPDNPFDQVMNPSHERLMSMLLNTPSDASATDPATPDATTTP